MKELEMGGPAFPITLNPGEDYGSHGPADGMYLRDWFAGLAMQGLLAAQIYGFNDRPAKGPFASMAYEMADAMLKERKGKETKMNIEKANQWLKQNYPQLEGYKVRAMSDYLYYTACLPEEETLCRDRVRSSPAPKGFVYVIARRLVDGVYRDDVVLLMPEFD